MPDETKFSVPDVVFLFTDVVGSSRLHEQYPAAMRAAMTRHDACISEAVETQGGRILKLRGGGDSVFAVFTNPAAAVRAAYAMQQKLVREVWPDSLDFRVRVGLHIGETEERDGDFRGNDVNRCARLRDIGHGGQVLLSGRMAEAAQQAGLLVGVGLRDLGLHRLRDLQQAEYVYQLIAPDLPDDFPPLNSLSLSPNNLPERLDSFLGRENDVETVRQMLSRLAPVTRSPSGRLSPTLTRQQTRLTTILGTGGCGKTRLAIQVGAELLEEFPDGVWLIELAGLSDGKLVGQAAASVLGIRDSAGGSCEAIIAHCRSKSLLILLDNCEHLLADCAQLVESLLRACPNLTILATSREPLEVQGERHYPLPTLAVPDIKELPEWEAIAAFPAVRLFADRAQARKSGFAVGADNAELVARICSRLDGVPLCIELVAPKVTTLTLKQIDARLYALIRAEAPNVPERQRNLRALLQWSVDLLDAPDRLLLPRLSVFAGGWTLEAAERIGASAGLDSDAIVLCLMRLVNASLVVAEIQGEAYRYRLLETVREYAREDLAFADEETETQDRHVAYFLELAEQCEPKLQGPEQAATLKRIETELDNFRAALKWAVRDDARLRLASALWRFWANRFLTEGRGWLENALQSCRHASPAVRAKGLNALGLLMTRQGEYKAAQSLLEESLRLREQIGEASGEAETLNNLGHVWRGLGDKSLAKRCYEHSLEKWRRLKDDWGCAACLNNLGMMAQSADDAAAARTHFQESLAIYAKLNDPAMIAATSVNLGVVLDTEGHYDQARCSYERGLEIYQQLKNQWAAAVCLYNIGEMARKCSDVDTATDHLFRSVLLRAELDDKANLINSLASLGQVFFDTKEFGKSVLLLGAAETASIALADSVSETDRRERQMQLEFALTALPPGKAQKLLRQSQQSSVKEIAALIHSNVVD